MIRRIADAGHEVASHGFGHQRASDQVREAFLADIRLAKAVLEDIAGAKSPDIARRIFRWPCHAVGVRLHRRGRLQVQLEHLPDPP